MSPRTDILLPGETAGRGRIPPGAFVPIAIAVVGVAVILFGGVSARTTSTAEAPATIDPVATGSIATPETPEEQRRALERLDR
jgi:hypothetical protein